MLVPAVLFYMHVAFKRSPWTRCLSYSDVCIFLQAFSLCQSKELRWLPWLWMRSRVSPTSTGSLFGSKRMPSYMQETIKELLTPFGEQSINGLHTVTAYCKMCFVIVLSPLWNAVSAHWRRSLSCGTTWTSWSAWQMFISGQVTPKMQFSNLNKPRCWTLTSSRVSYRRRWLFTGFNSLTALASVAKLQMFLSLMAVLLSYSLTSLSSL